MLRLVVNKDYKDWILFQSNDNFSSYLGDKIECNKWYCWYKLER